MSRPADVPPPGESDSAEHTHHWLIGDQDGPSSPAVCKDCGERREFSNSLTRRKSPWMTRSRVAQAHAAEDALGKDNDCGGAALRVIPAARCGRRIRGGAEPRERR